jgi:peptidyl-prolyl cis-trans isomerase D
MSIIQSLRNKAWLIIGAIAVALIAFIVQDRFIGGSGKNSLFGGNADALGKVNGTTISAVDFNTRYQAIEENYKNRNYPLNDMMRNRIKEDLWNNYVEDALLSKIYDKLGFDVNDKELGDILYGANPPQELRQGFTDSTGRYNAEAAYQRISSFKKNSPEYNNFWGQYVPEQIKNRLRDKYITLIGQSMYVPRWLVEKTSAENSQLSSIDYVQVPYSSIPDSSVKVSDDEIKDYVNAHKSQYKQEATRTVQYVTFDASPTKADSTEVLNQVASMKTPLTETKDVQNFLISNNSEVPFYDGYVFGSRMQMSSADTIRKLPIDAVYGPYLDGPNYVVARMLDKRMIPDSVKCRHILVKIADPQKGQVRTDSAAKKLIDSLDQALKNGAKFDSLVVKFSDDEGSNKKGGEYEFAFAQFANLSREFAEVIFYGKTGDKKIVKVENQQYSGYHYIEVLSQKKSEEAFKVAYFSRSIVPSDNTTNTASGLAAQFAAQNRDLKDFNAAADKQKLQKANGIDIKPLDNSIMGLEGDNREMVRWIFEAKKGDVAERPYQVGDKFVVPALLEIYDKGPMSVDKARPMVEFKIRNNKKAEQIIKKLAGATTMDAATKATGMPIKRADSLRFNNPTIAGVATEPKVVGAAFNPNFKTPKTSGPIKGELGVYVITVGNISAEPNPNFDVKQQQAAMQRSQGGMIGYGAIESLKKSASIKDYRDRFY